MSQKKCPSCRRSVPDNAKFCPDCGSPVTSTNKAGEKKAKGNALRDTLIIVGVLVIVAVVYIVAMDPKEVPKPPQQTNQNHSDVGSDGMAAMADLPADYNGLILMGNETMDKGNYAMAAECYRRALAIDGSSPDVRTDYGACLHGMGLSQRAIEEFMTVLKTHPEHSIANFNLGIVYYGMNKTDSAKTYFKKYLQIDPNGQASQSAKQYLKEIG